MRITIVTPGHLASNPRVVKEAMALHHAGHVVTIVHGQSVPGLIKQDATVVGPEWTVRPVPFGRRCAGLVRHLIQSVGTHLSFWLFDWMPTSQLRLKLASRGTSPIVADLQRTCRRIGADLIITHYTAGLVAGALAAKYLGVPFTFDAEDFHLGDYPDTGEYARTRKMIRYIESAYLPEAVQVTAAAPLIAAAYHREYGIESTVILNCFPMQSALKTVEPRGSMTVPSIYWFSQTIGPDRGLECAILAMAASRCRPHLYLRGYLKKGYSSVLVKLARENGVEGMVHFLPVASPDEMVTLCVPYDVGLIGETGETENRRIALTNKQFTYFLAGLPALMSDVPAHRQFAEEAGQAVSLYRTGDAISLAGLLDKMFECPQKLAECREAALRSGKERYNWENEAPKLVSVVNRIASNTYDIH